MTIFILINDIILYFSSVYVIVDMIYGLLSHMAYEDCSKSIWRDFFPRKLMNQGRCAVEGRWRVPSCAYVDFFPPADSVSRVQPACKWECIRSARHILRKWRNDSSNGIATNFARSLAIAKWKPFGRFSGFSATMPWASHKLKIGTTDSKLAARRWRTTLVPIGPQQAEMKSSLTNCGFWSCKTVMSPSENLRRWWG